MKKIHFLGVLLFMVITFSACESNDDNSNSGPNDAAFSQNFGNRVNRDFIGQVVDTNNNPLQGVAIKIGSSTVQTDVNGVFIINGAEVHERFAFVTAKKAGFIDGSRSMVPTSGKNNVKIMLIPNTPIQTIQSGVTSEVALSSGTKVVFDGAFEDANGNNYNGPVQVALFHLLPSNDNIEKLMPGMLYAQTETNQQAVLETFGMINVELHGSAGQKLNIKEGHTAEITLQIENSQVATAPNTIPLWHFDEERGYWKEEGVATKIGNKYVGEVSHFSWWNCDFPYSVITLTVKVVDHNGNPISNIGIGLLMNGLYFPAMGFTNEDGIATGFIPPNQTLNMEIYSDFYICNTSNVIYSASIGPFNTDTILPDIVITPTSSTLISEVQGKLLKCDNTNVTNGYVILTRNGSSSISYVTNGAFSFHEIYCVNDTQFYLAGMDFESFQPTEAIPYNFINPITIIGNLQTCNTVEEFISLQIDDQPPIIYTNSQVYGNGSPSPLSPNYLYVAGYNGSLFFSITGNQISVGSYNTNLFRINATFGAVDSSVQNTMQFNLNNFGAIGEHIDMTFSGSFSSLALGSHTISGVVHVIRDY